MTNRLFIALNIPENILDQIVLFRDEIYGNSKPVKWELKEKLHITLKFLGDVDARRLSEIKDCLANSVENIKPFKLEFGRFGIFDDRDGNPGIVWLGTKKSEQLINLAKNIEHDFEGIGFQKEKRKFKSHLTLLRVKGKGDFDKIREFRAYQTEDLFFTSDSVGLYESTLKRSGSEYKELLNIKLS